MDTTGGTCLQAVRLAWPRREPYFRRSRISQKPETARTASQGRDECPVCTGESATVSRQISSLSREERAKDAGRMAVEPRARLYHGGKCYGFAANQFTFPKE